MSFIKDFIAMLAKNLQFKKDKKVRDEKIDKATEDLVEKVQDPKSTEKDKKDAFKDYLDNLPK